MKFDSIRLFLQSIAKYRELPEDVLVLPSHGKPFRGAHARVAELEAHHAVHFKELEDSLKKTSSSAAELLGVLFRALAKFGFKRADWQRLRPAPSKRMAAVS